MSIIKPIRVFTLPEAREYLASLEAPVRKQFGKAFDKAQLGSKGEWFKKMVNTEDIYEFRVSHGTNAHRIFAFWDTTGDTDTLIVCTHGLNKKSQKTPKAAIKKAEQLKKQYFGQ